MDGWCGLRHIGTHPLFHNHQWFSFAIMSQVEHDNPAIHGFLEKTEAHAAGTNWDAERQAFWQAFAKLVE